MTSLWAKFNNWLHKPEPPEGFSGMQAMQPLELDDGPPIQFEGYSKSEWSRAALRIVTKSNNYSCSDSSRGGTVEQCQRVLDEIQADRDAFDDIQPEKLRKYIRIWFDHFEWDAQRKMKDCQSQKEKKERDAFRAKLDRESENVNSLVESIQRVNGHKP